MEPEPAGGWPAVNAAGRARYALRPSPYLTHVLRLGVSETLKVPSEPLTREMTKHPAASCRLAPVRAVLGALLDQNGVPDAVVNSRFFLRFGSVFGQVVAMGETQRFLAHTE